MRAYLILVSVFLACATPDPKTPQVPITTPPASQPAPERVVLLIDITEPSSSRVLKTTEDQVYLELE